jgi:hypothetical protein
VLAASTFHRAVGVQEKELAAARTLEDPFGAFQLEVVELDHVAQIDSPK